MRSPKYIALFILIQLISWPLFFIGLPICAILAALNCRKVTRSTITKKVIDVWPSSFWLWSNDEDGVSPPGYQTRWGTFVWAAWRNSVNNLRFVPGVSGKGRPLYYRNWTICGKEYYFKAGWSGTDGWPMLSAGSGGGGG